MVLEKIIIAAIAKNNVIGNSRTLPWYYKEDMKHFKKTTIHHAVIMGRKTWDSLPRKPLPERKNIVISLKLKEEQLPKDVVLARNIQEAFDLSREYSKAFVIGGAKVFELALPLVERIIITEIHREYQGDIYFPTWREEDWKEVERKDLGMLSFVEYVRRVIY